MSSPKGALLLNNSYYSIGRGGAYQYAPLSRPLCMERASFAVMPPPVSQTSPLNLPIFERLYLSGVSHGLHDEDSIGKVGITIAVCVTVSYY